MHMEEIDLCWRLWRHGYRVRVEPASKVYHIGGGSLPQGNPRKVYYNFRNSLLMLYKNLSPARWRTLLPQRAALDSLALLRALGSGKGEEARAILQAYRDAHRLRDVYQDMRPTSAERSVLPPYRGSIVLDYFLRGRRRFLELPQDKFRTPRSG
jgi:GT2 family glycosyltransferase